MPHHHKIWIVEAALTALAGCAPGVRAQAAPAPSAHATFTVTVAGQGQPIIMIPGLASSGATWDGITKHLEAHFRCFQLTLAGFAGVPPIDDPLLATAREQIAAYIRDNHLDRPVILGHSLGGSIALDLAERDPQLVGPVIVVDSLPFFAQAWLQVDSLAAAQPTVDKMRAGMDAMSHEQWMAYTKFGASTKGIATAPADQATLVQWGLASDQKSGILICQTALDRPPSLTTTQ